MSYLHEAVRSGNLDLIRDILQRDSSCVNDRNIDYETPLHVWASLSRRQSTRDEIPIFQILVDHGADVNSRDRFYTTPLHVIARTYKIELVELLLKHGADPNLLDSSNCTALHRAIHFNRQIIELFLEYGADIDAVDWNGCTPLAIAIYKRKFDNALILIDAGAKLINLFDAILFSTRKFKNERTIKLLIQYGTQISERQFSTRTFYFACLKRRTYGSPYVQKLLFEQGIDIENLKREGKEMPELHIAAKEGDEVRIQSLLQAGAPVNAKNILCETPLHVLLNNQSSDREQLYRIAKLFIEAGADLYAQDWEDFTPFQRAASKYYHEIVNLMMAKIGGVQECTLENEKWNLISIKVYEDYRNWYPLAVAIILDYEEVVDRLIGMRHHMEVASYSNYKPPLYYAIIERRYKIAKMLLEAGYRIDERYPRHIPSINPEFNSDFDGLELVYLLWEFNCTSILRRSLLHNIRKFWGKSDDTENFKSLVVFCFKIDFRSKKLNYDCISMEQYLNKNLSLILTSYYDEQIIELEKDLVFGKVSKFKLLTMELDSLVKFLNDKENFKACEKLRLSFNENTAFESYKFALKIRIDLALNKRRLLDAATDFLTKVFHEFTDSKNLNYLPYEIIYNIIAYFNIRELKKMYVYD